MNGKMEVVRGGGAGIGRACAQMLAARGAAVAVVDIDENSARETASLIERAGGRAAAFRADTSQALQLDRAIDGAIAALGPSRSWSTTPASSTATSTCTR